MSTGPAKDGGVTYPNDFSLNERLNGYTQNIPPRTRDKPKQGDNGPRAVGFIRGRNFR